jgi:hypothetical protein
VPPRGADRGALRWLLGHDPDGERLVWPKGSTWLLEVHAGQVRHRHYLAPRRLQDVNAGSYQGVIRQDHVHGLAANSCQAVDALERLRQGPIGLTDAAAAELSVLQVEGELDLGLGRCRDVARGHLSPGPGIAT